jgi:SAM-dependent methyltransferase
MRSVAPSAFFFNGITMTLTSCRSFLSVAVERLSAQPSIVDGSRTSQKRMAEKQQNGCPYPLNYYQALQEGALRSAREIVPMVLNIVRPGNVIDIGCGLGTWLSVFKEHGLDDIIGVDGPWVELDQLRFPKEHFLVTDLRQPLNIERKFDLVVCLEVAEHLPVDSAETLIESLTRLGPIILFSAAVPLQGGISHLNEQWPDYWAEMFLRRGYIPIDCLRKDLWQNDDVEWWYAQNILFFAKKASLEDYPVLKMEQERRRAFPLSICHPRMIANLQSCFAELHERMAEFEEQLARSHDEV